MKTTTRQKAIKLRLIKYFTGKPCVRGHIAERFTSNNHCKVCSKLNAKNWAENNHDKCLIITRRWRKNNPEKSRARTKKWRKNNSKTVRVIYNNWRARKRNAKGKHTKHDISRLFFKQKGKCAAKHCRVSIIKGYHVDHKKPLIKGGSNWPRNLQLLCSNCNTKKGFKTMKEWNLTMV